MNTLRFAGTWPLWQALIIALLLAATAFVLYRKETRRLLHPGACWLPRLRAAAVFLIVLMLAGPVVRHTRINGEMTRLLVLTDSSKSMGVPDPDMELSRKLMISSALGWLPGSLTNPTGEAAAELAAAHTALDEALSAPNQTDAELLQKLTATLDHTKTATKLLANANFTKARVQDLEQLVCTPLQKTLSQSKRSLTLGKNFNEEAHQFLKVIARVRRNVDELTRTNAEHIAGGNSSVAAALQRFDKTSRSERAAGLLLEGSEQGLLRALTSQFEIHVFSIGADHTTSIWNSAAGLQNLPSALPAPVVSPTDLHNAILSQTLSKKRDGAPESQPVEQKQQQTAVLLLTDGQHNAGQSPVELAKQLGERGIPLICVGIGNQTAAPDLAISGVQTPETVFADDRIRGVITLKDEMPPGLPYQLKVHLKGRTVWQKDLVTQRRHQIKVPFEISVKELDLEEPVTPGGRSSAVRHSAVGLRFEASIQALDQERERRNNTKDFLVRVTTGKRKMLIADGRSRWDALFVRNLFESDPQWEVNALFADAIKDGAASNWQRGEHKGMFPESEEQLRKYDAIVLGDLPQRFLRTEELSWIVNFVEKRGGGLLFVDGPRGALRQYADETGNPFAPLFPITFRSPLGASGALTALAPTERGMATGILNIDPSVQTEPQKQWSRLPAPRWIGNCEALPGTETLLEAVHPAGRIPALVWRQFGAGRVAYLGFEESWRWRADGGEKYQEKFWKQLIPAISEPLYSTQGETLSIDTDSFSYLPGSSAEIRAKIRDPRTQTSGPKKWSAVLQKDGKRFSSMPLTPTNESATLFTAKTTPLESGSYSLSVETEEGPWDAAVHSSFEVAPQPDNEMVELTLNEELLAVMAAESGGKYFREEDADKIKQYLTPLATGRLVETETPLWQSYWWFSTIIALLTAEWILRKKIGLV